MVPRESAPVPHKYWGSPPRAHGEPFAPLLCQRCGRRWSGLVARHLKVSPGWEIFCEVCLEEAGLSW